MRRYELMLVLRPDTADDRVQQILDRTTRGIAGSEGQIVKVSPWGRRRLAYPISGYREGSYFIVVFDAPSEAIDELERSLNITEEIIRHLVTRIERPAGSRRSEKGRERRQGRGRERRQGRGRERRQGRGRERRQGRGRERRHGRGRERRHGRGRERRHGHCGRRNGHRRCRGPAAGRGRA